jgi:hypothetical protein
MTSDQHVSSIRRRWYRFGLGELALLAVLLIPVWWFAATRLISVQWIDSESDGQFVRQEWRNPRRLQIVDRGLKWSLILVASWFVLRARFKANSAQVGEVKPGPVSIALMVLYLLFAIGFFGIALLSYFTGASLN